jgi:hypothetical protein
MAVVQTLHVEPGATFDSVEFQYLDDDGVTPYPLTGFTATFIARNEEDGSTILSKTLTISAQSMISTAMTAAETALFANKTARYVVKVVHSSSEPVIQIARGKIVPEPDEVY